MINKEDIGIICNYQESNITINPNSKITFFDFISNDYEYQRELKMKNRSLAIDVLLDDKEREYNNREISIKIDGQLTGTGILIGASPTLYSINLPKPLKYKSYEDIWKIVIDHIEINSQNPHTFMQKLMGTQFFYTQDPNKTDKENREAKSKRLISKIMSASYDIGTLSRRGPANFMIIGTDILNKFNLLHLINRSTSTNKYIIGDITGITIILSEKIKPNKIIVGRTESKIENGGLILLNDLNNFYLTETRRTFYERFIWFDV
jgi:hypothetical protein